MHLSDLRAAEGAAIPDARILTVPVAAVHTPAAVAGVPGQRADHHSITLHAPTGCGPNASAAGPATTLRNLLHDTVDDAVLAPLDVCAQCCDRTPHLATLNRDLFDLTRAVHLWRATLALTAGLDPDTRRPAEWSRQDLRRMLRLRRHAHVPTGPGPAVWAQTPAVRNEDLATWWARYCAESVALASRAQHALRQLQDGWGGPLRMVTTAAGPSTPRQVWLAVGGTLGAYVAAADVLAATGPDLTPVFAVPDHVPLETSWVDLGPVRPPESLQTLLAVYEDMSRRRTLTTEEVAALVAATAPAARR